MAALNAGLHAARGPLVARIDGDDLMHPDRLGEQVYYMRRHSEHTLVTSRIQLEPPDSPMHGYVAWLNSLDSPAAIRRSYYIEAPVCHPAVMFRSAEVLAAGGYADRGWPEDYDLWLRLLEGGAEFGTVDKTLTVWRDLETRLTRTDPRYARARFVALKAHMLARRFSEVRIWGAGRDGRRLARALEAEGTRITAFFDVDPKKIGGVRRGDVPVRGPDAVGPGPTILTAVGIPEARASIRAHLEGAGLVDGVDFICCA